MSRLMRFPDSTARDPRIDEWMSRQPAALGEIARSWFRVLRESGEEVREILHDGHPTACVRDAAFAYVNAFASHVNVGFFRGAELPDPYGLLEGTGKLMRHVKIRPGSPIDTDALAALIATAHADMQRRIAAED